MKSFSTWKKFCCLFAKLSQIFQLYQTKTIYWWYAMGTMTINLLSTKHITHLPHAPLHNPNTCVPVQYNYRFCLQQENQFAVIIPPLKWVKSHQHYTQHHLSHHSTRIICQQKKAQKRAPTKNKTIEKNNITLAEKIYSEVLIAWEKIESLDCKWMGRWILMRVRF